MSIGSRGYRRQYEPPDRRRWIVAAGAVVVAAAVGIGGAYAFGFIGSTQQIQRTATTDNMNCTLIVPANPLSAQGLATPYQLTATNPADGPCNEANAAQSAFVQGAVLDPATGQISVYNPLVIDQGTTAAVAPVVPALPANAVVGIWFGFNGNTLTLAGADQVGGTATAAATAAPTVTAATTTAATAAAATSAATGVTATPTPLTTAASTAAAAVVAPAVATSPTGAAAPSASASGPATMVTPSASTAASATASAPAAATVTTPAVTGTAPPANTDTPAASGTPDAILQGADCIAGENIAGQGFSSFTQVAACNAVAFFQAANTAIRSGLLTVPSPGTATDGQPCLTTRNFGIIDQDQSDNVTTKYLANANGQTAQDNAANAAALAGATPLFNGSDNALIDDFVDPALTCTPWMVNDLANPGQTATALPLDELQSAAFDGGNNGGPEALVPLNDPMTLDNNGNFSTDKTNTYRSIVDMPNLPTGESPAEYCGDMESIQGVRLQQDVNLLINGTSPMPAAASNLFTFLAMRLQQSFTNLNCQNFGLQNDVSTTVDGNGVVVAACFLQQVNAVTAGAGNPTHGMTVCPATTATAAASATATAAPTVTASATAAPTATATAVPTAAPTTTGTTTTTRHRRHHHRFF
jgi:hypothetical protein